MEKVINPSPDRKYFTQVCNLIDELDLSPLAIALYLHYKRFSDTGRTDHPGVKTLMKKYRCGSGAVADAKKELEDAGLIKVNRFPKRECRPDEIEILDIWERNVKHFQSDSIPVTNQRQVSDLPPDSDSPDTNQRQPCHQPVTALTPDSDSLKDKEFKDSKNLNTGGNGTSTSREDDLPTAGSNSPGDVQKESFDEFVIRMQVEFKLLDVPALLPEFKKIYLNAEKSPAASLDDLRVDFRKFLVQREIVRGQKVKYADYGFDVDAIWKDFLEKCGSWKYPNLLPTKENFEKWMSRQYENVEINLPSVNGDGSNGDGSSSEGGGYRNPMTGRSFV